MRESLEVGFVCGETTGRHMAGSGEERAMISMSANATMDSASAGDICYAHARYPGANIVKRDPDSLMKLSQSPRHWLNGGSILSDIQIYAAGVPAGAGDKQYCTASKAARRREDSGPTSELENRTACQDRNDPTASLAMRGWT